MINKIYLDMDDVLVDFESYISQQILSLLTDKSINHPSLTFLRSNVEKLGNLSTLGKALRSALNMKDSQLELNEMYQHLLKVSYIPIGENQAAWESLPTSSKAKELVGLSISLVGFENVNLLTAPLDKHCIRGKQVWIQNHFPEFTSKVIYNSQKHLWAFPDAILIDDRIKNIEAWNASGGKGILYQDHEEALSQIFTLFTKCEACLCDPCDCEDY